MRIKIMTILITFLIFSFPIGLSENNNLEEYDNLIINGTMEKNNLTIIVNNTLTIFGKLTLNDVKLFVNSIVVYGDFYVNNSYISSYTNETFLFKVYGNLTLQDSTVSKAGNVNFNFENIYTYSGIEIYGNTLILNSIVTASNQTGIFCKNANLKIFNSIIYRNSLYDIVALNSTITIENSVIDTIWAIDSELEFKSNLINGIVSLWNSSFLIKDNVFKVEELATSIYLFNSFGIIENNFFNRIIIVDSKNINIRKNDFYLMEIENSSDIFLDYNKIKVGIVNRSFDIYSSYNIIINENEISNDIYFENSNGKITDSKISHITMKNSTLTIINATTDLLFLSSVNSTATLINTNLSSLYTNNSIIFVKKYFKVIVLREIFNGIYEPIRALVVVKDKEGNEIFRGESIYRGETPLILYTEYIMQNNTKKYLIPNTVIVEYGNTYKKEQNEEGDFIFKIELQKQEFNFLYLIIAIVLAIIIISLVYLKFRKKITKQ